jgi:hypothetical protein
MFFIKYMLHTPFWIYINFIFAQKYADIIFSFVQNTSILRKKEDLSYLIKFYENLLLGKNNNLHSKYLIIEELFK